MSRMRRRTADSEARCIRDWSRSKLGRPSLVESHHLAVEHDPARAERARQLAHLGVAGREVAAVPAAQLDVAVVREQRPCGSRPT